MYFLTYISERTENHALDLNDLLKEARIKNLKNNLTGILLFRSQTFFQLLEGRKEDVLTTFQKIADDPRHEKLEVLFEIELDEPRIFPSWQMGLIDEPQAAPEQEALAKSLRSLAFSEKPHRETILALLRKFSAIARPPLSARDILARAKQPR